MPNTHPECTDLNNCRTVSSIVWTCAATLFICIWTCIHPNVPGIGGTTWTRLGRRLALMLLMIIAPEFIVFWATKQFVCARAFSRKHNLSLTHGFFFNMGGFAKYTDEGICYLTKSPDPILTKQASAAQTSMYNPPIPLQSTPSSHLTIHTTLNAAGTSMSDIELDSNIQSQNPVAYSPDPHPKVRELGGQTPEATEIISSSRSTIHTPTVATSSHISDIELISNVRSENLEARSRSDPLTKGIAAMQLSWFLVQCIARGVDGLAITELEISTAAFSLLTVVTYGAWLYKPFDVAMPIILNRLEGEQDVLLQSVPREKRWTDYRVMGVVNGLWNFLTGRHFDHNDQDDERLPVPIRWSGDDSDVDANTRGTIVFLLGLCVSICFAIIHCIAWEFEFPTPREKSLWIKCSTTILVIPCVVMFIILVLVNFPGLNTPRGFKVAQCLMGIASALYMVARIGLLVLSFIALRALPPSAYRTVDWLKLVKPSG